MVKIIICINANRGGVIAVSQPTDIFEKQLVVMFDIYSAKLINNYVRS